MDPKKWGPTFWWFLEWLANKIDSSVMVMRENGHTDKSATNIQLSMLKQFTQFVDVLGRQLLPCRTCQDSTKVFLRLTSPKQVIKQFQSSSIPTASLWLLQLHNLVNVKLKKPRFSIDQSIKYQSSTKFQAFPLQNLQFVESAILHCLTKWPQRKRFFVQAFSEFLSPLLFSVYQFAPNLTPAQRKSLLEFAQRYEHIRL